MDGSRRGAFESLTIGPLRLRNRFIKAATNEGRARGGQVTEPLIRFHAEVAAGGAGMSTLAYCAVSPDGRTFDDQLCLAPAALPGLRRLTSAVHAQGAAACAQITHGGAFNFLTALSTPEPLSASGGFNPPGLMAGRWFKRAMDEADLQAVAGQFVDGARLARQAGFDAVEIHMGHGYLLSQFLSPVYNRRRDAWGGDAARRAAFPVEVLRRVLDAVGGELAVLCKLGVHEGHRRGASLDEVVLTARALEQAGAHLLVLSAGMNVEAPWAIFGSPLPVAAMTAAGRGWIRHAGALMALRQPRTPFRPMYLLEHSRVLRQELRLPLAYLGGVTAPADVRLALDSGFEAVAMGRALIHDPQLIRRWQQGSEAPSGCTACNGCVAQMYRPGGTACVLRMSQPNSL